MKSTPPTKERTPEHRVKKFAKSFAVILLILVLAAMAPVLIIIYFDLADTLLGILNGAKDQLALWSVILSPLIVLLLCHKPFLDHIQNIREVYSQKARQEAPSALLGLCTIIWKNLGPAITPSIILLAILAPDEYDSIEFTKEYTREFRNALIYPTEYPLFGSVVYLLPLVFFFLYFFTGFDRNSLNPDIYAISNLKWHKKRQQKIRKKNEEAIKEQAGNISISPDTKAERGDLNSPS